ncbi:hypothetical protein H0H92_013400, partial [Tricholoma furcatifolium]
HRLTASLVAMLLMDGFKHPHSVLNTYIEGLTRYRAQDASEYIKQEGRSSVEPFFKEFGKSLKGDKIMKPTIKPSRPLARAITHSVIMHYILTGEHPPCFGPDEVNIVGSGVGQFKDDNMQVISLQQPVPTIGAATWLSERLISIETPRSLTSFENLLLP